MIVKFYFEDGCSKIIKSSSIIGIRHKMHRPIKAFIVGIKKYSEEYNTIMCAMKIGHQNNIKLKEISK